MHVCSARESCSRKLCLAIAASRLEICFGVWALPQGPKLGPDCVRHLFPSRIALFKFRRKYIPMKLLPGGLWRRWQAGGEAGSGAMGREWDRKKGQWCIRTGKKNQLHT